MILQVECRPGLHGDMEPVTFRLGGSRIEVREIIDRWLSVDCSYFKVDAGDGSTCILRHTPSRQEWELTLYEAPGRTNR